MTRLGKSNGFAAPRANSRSRKVAVSSRLPNSEPRASPVRASGRSVGSSPASRRASRQAASAKSETRSIRRPSGERTWLRASTGRASPAGPGPGPEVGGGGRRPVRGGGGGGAPLGGPRRAEAVSQLGLGRADRQAREAAAEHAPKHVDLHRVVLAGAGAVRVDVVDRLGRHAGVG